MHTVIKVSRRSISGSRDAPPRGPRGGFPLSRGRYSNDVRSFDLARGEESQSHLDVYFNDRLVLSTKGRAGQSDSLDAKEIEGLISEWKAKAAKS